MQRYRHHQDRYRLREDDEGCCPRCQTPLRLLEHATRADGWPTFSICFICQEVVQIDGDDGQVVQYKGGRRRKYERRSSKDVPPHPPPKRRRPRRRRE